MFGYMHFLVERKWKIGNHPAEFNSLMEMKDHLRLHKRDTVFDYARRNNLKIYCNEGDNGYVLVYHAKEHIGV